MPLAMATRPAKPPAGAGDQEPATRGRCFAGRPDLPLGQAGLKRVVRVFSGKGRLPPFLAPAPDLDPGLAPEWCLPLDAAL